MEKTMSWLRIDDAWPEHPAIAGLKPTEKVLWLTAAAWSARQATLGMIPKQVMPIVIAQSGAAKTAPAALVAAGLWEQTTDGWEFSALLNPFPTQAAIDAKRERDRQRQALRRARQKEGDSDPRHAGVTQMSQRDTKATRSQVTSDVTQKVASKSRPVSIPEPEPDVNKLSETTTVVPLVTSPGGGGPDRITEAIEALADAEPQPAHPPSNPAAYRRAIVRRLRSERGPELTRLAKTEPELTGPELAERMLESKPIPPLRPIPASESDAVRDTRRGPDACPACQGTGWTTTKTGDAIACTSCQGAA